MRKGSKNRDSTRRALARSFRTEMGVSERVFWELVRKERLGFAFRRQVPIDKFVLDFYCAEGAVCVEIDGEMHLAYELRDEVRDKRLLELGIETYRIPSQALFDKTSARIQPLIATLVELLEMRSGRKADVPRNLETRKRRRWYGL